MDGSTRDGGTGKESIPLRSQLNSDIWLEGDADGASTVEIGTRSGSGTLRRVRVRRYEDGGLEIRTVPRTGGGSTAPNAARGIRARAFDRIGDVLFVLALLVAAGTVTGFATMHVVASGSMAPRLGIGDLVVAVSDEFMPPQVGDIVIFRGTKLSGEAIGPFAHRIVGGNPVDGWVTKGDANESPDSFRSTSVEIMGRMLFSVPGVGLLLEPRNLLLLLGGLVVFLLLR